MAKLFQFELEHIIPSSFFGTGSDIDTLLTNSGFTSGNMRDVGANANSGE